MIQGTGWPSKLRHTNSSSLSYFFPFLVLQHQTIFFKIERKAKKKKKEALHTLIAAVSDDWRARIGAKQREEWPLYRGGHLGRGGKREAGGAQALQVVPARLPWARSAGPLHLALERLVFVFHGWKAAWARWHGAVARVLVAHHQRFCLQLRRQLVGAAAMPGLDAGHRVTRHSWVAAIGEGQHTGGFGVWETLGLCVTLLIGHVGRHDEWTRRAAA